MSAKDAKISTADTGALGMLFADLAHAHLERCSSSKGVPCALSRVMSGPVSFFKHLFSRCLHNSKSIDSAAAEI